MAVGALVGNYTYAADLNLLLPTIVTKASGLARASTATPTIDPDLQVALGVGTYAVRMQLFVTIASGTPGFKTRWGMSSGSMTDVVRGCMGPATSTAGPTVQTTINMAGAATNADASYTVASGGTFSTIREEVYSLNVTVAGTFGLLWSQVTSTAVNVTLQGQSAMEIRQIA